VETLFIFFIFKIFLNLRTNVWFFCDKELYFY